MNKTPVTVLQELMITLGEVPSYKCVSQSGPQHLSVFEYLCSAYGVCALGVARSKKEAKQEAARRALAELAACGVRVPPPYNIAPAECDALAIASSSGEGGEGAAPQRPDVRSYVALLKELCDEYHLGAVDYELVSDTGPPHQRMFTVRASLAGHARVAAATTKKAARQMAAEQLYAYLRENLASATKDFVEKREVDVKKGQSEPEQCPVKEAAQDSPRKRKSTDEPALENQSKRVCDDDKLEEIVAKGKEEALSRALNKAMARYVEVREEVPWRPDLGQRIADYHRGVLTHISEEQREAAEESLAAGGGDQLAALERTAAALGMSVRLDALPGGVSVVALEPAAPAIALAAADAPAAAAAAMRYLRRALRQREGLPARALANAAAATAAATAQAN